jgi:hypothetical protein
MNFYNANIQNWGPGGVFKGEGGALRYPAIFRGKDSKTIRTKHLDVDLPADTRAQRSSRRPRETSLRAEWRRK